jgi:hypothetical protein
MPTPPKFHSQELSVRRQERVCHKDRLTKTRFNFMVRLFLLFLELFGHCISIHRLASMINFASSH